MTQEHPASGQAPLHSTSSSLPPGSPESTMLLIMAIAHTAAVSPCLRWGLQHPPSRNTSPLAEAGSKLLLTVALRNLKTDFACPAASKDI